MKKSKKKLLTPAQKGAKRAKKRLQDGLKERYREGKKIAKKTGLRLVMSGQSKGPVGTRLKKRSTLGK